MHSPTIDQNFASGILKRAKLDPKNTAIVFEGKSLSYGELALRVKRFAQSLKDGGVCLGDRVGFVGFNHPALLETMLAAHAIGAIFVPMNFRLTAEELSFIVNDAGIHTLVADQALSEVIDIAKPQLHCHRYVNTEAQGPSTQGWDHYEHIIEATEPLADLCSSDQHDIAVIMYTSGTTGKPKGAMLSHGNILWNNIQCGHAFPTMGSDTSLVCAPLFHIGGLNVTTLSTLQVGGRLVIHRSFDAEQALKDIERYQVTTSFAAPAMLLFMAQHPNFADSDLSSIRMIIVGAAPVPKSLLTTYNDRNIELNQGYGLTETAPLVSFLPAQYGVEKLGSAGKPGVYGDIKIIDAHSESVADGEVGEIVYRGPNVMRGYWNRPEATAQAIDNKGWFHTGDAGYLDEDGFLFISDRVKDMVISGGENVYPAEVESVLYEHPSIAEVAIIGLPDDKWGEAVTAVVALNAGCTLSLEELRDYADGKLARFKLPLRLYEVPALPRNPAGKVLKFQLREDYAQ